ncbi:MAG TPA: DNA-3-methyladenine glycosylase 2 family protein [Mycobacteriales bacterium]|nr:DNA-3-methyladenine glycosylase 2 family protein [Mycobacteriales bacterium]HWA68003.1 DNA-3-methyladenine glycosylase 2 family protein [Mycobacteriales bacterium]
MTIWQPGYPISVGLTLSVLQHGAADPCHRRDGDGSIWRTSRLATGPVSYRIRQRGLAAVEAGAWGPGADELIATLPDLLGSRDDPESFEPRVEIVRVAHRRLRGLRVPRTGRVLESLVPAVLEQRIVGVDAFAAWRRLVTKYGGPAPGPAPDGMRLPPTAEQWQDIPTWEWHRAGVEQRKAQTIALAASYAARLEAAAHTAAPSEVYRMLTALPGIGAWTAAEVGHRALGDADAAPIGDYHLPALLGEGLGDGTPIPHEECEAFLEPWRPHRYRLVRLLELSGVRRERRGPRMSRLDYRAI